MKYSFITSVYNQLPQLIAHKAAFKGQTYSGDYEWILAIDQDDQKTIEWAKKNVDKYVFQQNQGYRLVEILNKAARVATGDYLVFIMGDSYPKEDFLEMLDPVVAPDKLLSGIRVNINSDGLIISPDWRVSRVPFELDVLESEIRLFHPRPWELMTLNSMIIPREAFNRMGGIHSGYRGYGQMDWDMAAWCHYNGMILSWVPKAVVFHETHEEKEDTKENIEVFEKRLAQFQEPARQKSHRIKERAKKIIGEAQTAIKESREMRKKSEFILDQKAEEHGDE